MTVWRPHWRTYDDGPLPTGPEALHEPFSAFPSWYLRVVCARCGTVRMLNETHTPQRHLPMHEIIRRMRHAGCGGAADGVELLTGIEGTSSRPVRRIVLPAGDGPSVIGWP